MAESNSKLEETITAKVIQQLKLEISNVQRQNDAELWRIIQEEMALRDAEANEDVSAEDSAQEEKAQTRKQVEPEKEEIKEIKK